MSALRVAKDHLAVLDGLRGFAIVLVVWFHIWQISWLRADLPLFGKTFNFNVVPETGFVGVSLFFFISGFVIFYPYARTLFDGAPLQTTRTFYYRRLLKIVPSYYFSLVAMTALGLFTFSSQADEVRQLGFHAAFIFGFFPDTAGSLNGVLWSLAVEMEFYLIFPLICFCALRRPLWTFFALTVVALAYRALVIPRSDGAELVDQLPGVLDIFATGMFAAWAYRALATMAPGLAGRRWLWTLVAIVGLGLGWCLLESLFAVRAFPYWPLHWWRFGRSGLNAAFLLLTLGSLFAFPLWQGLLANRALVALSTISYNLYIWHYVIAQKLLDAKIPSWRTIDGHGDPGWQIGYTIVAAAVALLVSWAITVLLEQPLLRRRPLEAFFTGSRRAGVAATQAAVALVALLAALTSVSCAGLAATLPRPQHVIVIVEENKTLAEVVNGGSAPFIVRLARQGALFTNAHGVTHPSLPNYFALFAGLTNTNGDGCPAQGISAQAPNLATELFARRLSFVGYAENLPATGSRVCTAGTYARKHAPWVAFSNVPPGDSRPLAALPASYDALPTVAMLIPDVDDDMHDGTIAQGDDWLREHVAALLRWADRHDTLVVLTWDEGFDASNSIPTIFYGPMVKPGKYPERIDHYTTLRTLEALYGLAPTGRAAAVPPITECWR